MNHPKTIRRGMGKRRRRRFCGRYGAGVAQCGECEICMRYMEKVVRYV